MQLKKIHHVAIICSDYEKSKCFYNQILKFKIIHEEYRAERNSYKLDLAVGKDVQIELFSFPNSPQRLSYPEARGLRHLAFSTDRIEEWLKYLTDNGVKCEPLRVDEITGKRFTFFFDPDELPLELYEEKD